MNLEEIIRLDEDKLFKVLAEKHKKARSCPHKYILVPGNIPVMLAAHLDTVHEKPVKYICKNETGNIWMSPQGIGGDDRCGVYALETIHDEAEENKKPWLLYTCQEETGGIGAAAFCDDFENKKLKKELIKNLEDLKCIIEIDRKGHKDAVYYDCDNREFEEYITNKGFTTEFGSFSDISFIAPTLGVAAVNLSSGYYNAHTQHEYIKVSDLEDTIKKTKEILKDAEDKNFPQYIFIKSKIKNIYNSPYGYSSIWDWNTYGNVYESNQFQEDTDEYYMYDELLDYFTPDYLDSVIDVEGIEGLTKLYNDTFGIEEYQPPTETEEPEKELPKAANGN